MEYQWYIISSLFILVAGILIYKHAYILAVASIAASIMCMIELAYYKKLLAQRGEVNAKKDD